MTDLEKITLLCRQSLSFELDLNASMKIQATINKELDEIPNGKYVKDVMTLPEIANYLRVTEDTIEEMLGDIPCSELGGKLLFRKKAVDEWVESREKEFAANMAKFNINKDIKFTVA